MNRWENLYLIIYWNVAGRQAISVYSNNSKIAALTGASRPEVIQYIRDLRAQGWEKFAHDDREAHLVETYYFQRPMEEVGDLPLHEPLPNHPSMHHHM
jgi:hypothetical protein